MNQLARMGFFIFYVIQLFSQKLTLSEILFLLIKLMN